MRFAYIDSQGKEVGIPSVEALQLRIELGAIGEETMFFDGGTERWAPAKEHEIFRTLARELEEKGEGGFVAPPPPSIPQRPTPTTLEEEAATPAPGAEGEPASGEEGVGEGEAAAEDDGDVTSFDFGLELVEEEGWAARSDAGGPDSAADALRDAPAGPGEFDFGDLDSLDLGAGTAEAAEGPPGWAGDAPRPSGALDDAGAERDEGTADGGGRAAAPDEPAYGESLDLEPPLSEYSPDDTPARGGGGPDAPPATGGPVTPPAEDPWADDRPPTARRPAGPERRGGEDPLPEHRIDEGPVPEHRIDEERDVASSSGGSAPARPHHRGSAQAAPGRGPQRKARAARLRREKRSSFGRIAAGVAVLAVVGAVAWLGWGYLRGGLGDEAQEAQVELQPLPADLRPAYEAATAPAHAALVDSLRILAGGLPRAPSEQWLSGNYLANASLFPGVPEYWTTIRGWVERARVRDEAIFMAAFGERLDSLGVPASARETLEDRARAGFRASGTEREAVYDQLDALALASLDLHDFLLGNEEDIDYEPSAAGLSRDPVTEAIPATEELGDRMWDEVAEITAALDDLGALERLTSERLLEIVLEKLSGIPVR